MILPEGTMLLTCRSVCAIIPRFKEHVQEIRRDPNEWEDATVLFALSIIIIIIIIGSM